jgi:hypothetical protein
MESEIPPTRIGDFDMGNTVHAQVVADLLRDGWSLLANHAATYLRD